MRLHSKIAFAALGLVLGAAPLAAQDKIVVGMATGVNMVSSLVAEHQGYFEDEGINVELMPVVRGNLAIEAIVAGSMQFAEVSDAAFFQAVDQEVPLVALGAASRGFTGKLIARSDVGEVDTLSDLVGKRIGIQVGTGVHNVFLILADQEGLAESDFEVANVRVTDMPTAMASGDAFDAVFGWDPMMQRIVQAGYGVEAISADRFQELAGITYPLLLVADRDYIAANPDEVQAMVNAYHRAHAWIRDNPEEALAIYMESIRASGADLEEEIVRNMMFEVDKFMGAQFIESDWTELARTRDFLHAAGRISSQMDLEEITDTSFGERAAADSN